MDPVLEHAAATISVPKESVATSFTLHAPLELLARIGLLPLVHADRRNDALATIGQLAAEYESAGDPVRPPKPVGDLPVPELADRLLAAITAGDLDDTDALGVALLDRVSPQRLVELVGEPLVASLEAAGHTPIGMMLLGRVAPVQPGGLLRGALRRIAGDPSIRIHWHDEARSAGDPSRLDAVLRTLPHLGHPGSNFVYPLMTQVQHDETTVHLLRSVLAGHYDVVAVTRCLTRVAAWSMIHDDPTQAPYGWTHALTMPQAVMALAGHGVSLRAALAVAATYVAGFRVAYGAAPLPDVLTSGDARSDASWHDLATGAALHEDAHLVKYTLACWHAAADDPEFEPLYRAAAAYLADWWAADASAVR